jgi:hypothetical protein
MFVCGSSNSFRPPHQHLQQRILVHACGLSLLFSTCCCHGCCLTCTQETVAAVALGHVTALTELRCERYMLEGTTFDLQPRYASARTQCVCQILAFEMQPGLISKG